MFSEGLDVGDDGAALLAGAAIDDLNGVRLWVVGRDIEWHC